jgi:hypothetical protein
MHEDHVDEHVIAVNAANSREVHASSHLPTRARSKLRA